MRLAMTARMQINISRKMLFTWFMLAGLIFLFAPQGLTNKFQFAFTRVFRIPLSMGRSISLAAKYPTTTAVGQQSDYENHIANLTVKLQRQRKKLKELSGLRQRFPMEDVKFGMADIITAADTIAAELFINLGRKDGVKPGQFVLAGNSVIGTISDVSYRTAQVTLITDPASLVAVKIDGLKSGKLMRGSGHDIAKIEMLTRKHKVKKGAAIYAAKKANFLNDLIIVGRISECKRDQNNPLLWDITVKPVCDIHNLDSVAVIIIESDRN